ncbi:hypothetical protein BDV96DRAFT_481420 [Lophiotrema nucula]|uniref:C2H2-type domain-containing protein n=1 Tax=Lophiotrema nucula TaxID=690887 RepID=A0A6A5ZV92_9PLEO|nr:hypothetical protein BDV96DRAFT_481420 [Lophiotrema nucula]
MEQHRDAPSHDTMFSCDVCKRKFGSKQAVAQHKKSQSHARILARAEFTNGYAVNTAPNIENVRNNNIEEEYSDGEDSEDLWVDNSFVGWDDDQNWALCDKECGWCGHCADGIL